MPRGAVIWSSDCTKQFQFVQLNREKNYLSNEALVHGRFHNLESSIAQLYDVELNKIRRTRLSKTSKSSVQRKSVIYQHDIEFQWPVDKKLFWMSSFFGPRKKPNGSLGFHYGLDMAALTGTPVYAIAQGRVVEISYNPKGYGKSIVVAHSAKYKSRYAHLDSMCVRNGQYVRKGQRIGKVGATGNVRGKNASHLHLEIMLFGKKVNPLYILK